jgi:RNA polymerase sigma-70 factor (ECF subfamily)
LGEPGGPPLDGEVRSRVRNFAFRLTGDAHLAEDVAQETLVRALREGTPRDLPWLLRVALNLVRDDARRAAVRRATASPVDRVADPRTPEPYQVLAAEEERLRVWRALGRLPERERTAMLLRFGEGLPCADVAEVLGMTGNAVSCLLHRGKERMRGLLAPGSVSR